MLLRLYTLLLVLVVASASWAAFGTVGGTAVSAILLALAVQFWAGKSHRPRLLRAAAAILGLAALICLLVPAVNAARETARCSQCKNNLKQIGLALRNYWDTWGSFPPTSTYDESGRPMHSWRLLIKPYLDSSATYDSCNLNEPWNGASNRRLLAHREYIYQCPADPTAWAPDCTTTSYLAVVGRRAAWRWNRPETPEEGDLHRQSADTFLVVEMADSAVQWPEPKDVRFNDIPALRSLAAKSPHARNNGYFYYKTPALNAVLVHGDMLFIFPWDSTTGVLTGLLPPEKPRIGAERGPKYDPFSQLYREELRINWFHSIGLPVWIVAVWLLARSAGMYGISPSGAVPSRCR
jgi:hypothetical protein